jgi:hypothetical protein
MIEVRVDGDSLEIELSGWDAINVGTWKTHRSVRVPVRDVTDVTINPRFDLARRYMNVKASGRETGMLVCAHRHAPALELEVGAHSRRARPRSTPTAAAARGTARSAAAPTPHPPRSG